MATACEVVQRWNQSSPVLPAELGIDPKVAAAQKAEIGTVLKWRFVDSFARSDDAAIRLA